METKREEDFQRRNSSTKRDTYLLLRGPKKLPVGNWKRKIRKEILKGGTEEERKSVARTPREWRMNVSGNKEISG